MLGGPELLSIGLLFIIAALMGIAEGNRGGYKGVPLSKTCSKAIGRSFMSTSAAAFLIFVVLAIINFFVLGGGEALTLLFSAIVISPILGFLTSIIAAPMAAFLAYNFGARKRAVEDLAKPDHERDRSPP